MFEKLFMAVLVAFVIVKLWELAAMLWGDCPLSAHQKRLKAAQERLKAEQQAKREARQRGTQQ